MKNVIVIDFAYFIWVSRPKVTWQVGSHQCQVASLASTDTVKNDVQIF